ncbi:MAG: DoxX family protein [Flavobacteria bacterium RIFCSPLOWO2_12_FULL_35_11]|nr:MAG: DoxX family protein [Flavobacteria bacterium RIFCSPLOWO2_12_FULL_35_11]
MKQKILFVLCLLFGLMFINAGLNKFFNYMPVPEDMPEDSMQMFTAMMQIGWLMPLIAIAEIIGGILFIFTKVRALGAVILAPIMTGIMLTHFTIAPEGLTIVIPLLAIYLWVIYENRNKYLPMIN